MTMTLTHLDTLFESIKCTFFVQKEVAMKLKYIKYVEWCCVVYEASKSNVERCYMDVETIRQEERLTFKRKQVDLFRMRICFNS